MKLLIQKHLKTNQSAFTIVELLVVIVVIGILAAITILSYSGITAKARETQVINIIKSYQTALEMYVAEHESYPMVSSDICLGSTEDYPASGDFTEGSCSKAGSTPDRFTDDGTNSELESYMGGSVNALMPEVSFSDMTYRGPMYASSPDGSMAEIRFTIKSGSGCPIGSGSEIADGIYGCDILLKK